MEKEDKQLLLKLLSIHGISGFESNVRDFIKKQIKPLVDEVRTDKLGNLIAIHRGRKKRIMLAAHMDEIGFLVRKIHNNGSIEIEPVGTSDLSIFVGERIAIITKKERIPGIITTKRISKGDNLEENLKLEDMIIDTGLAKKELIKKGVEIGSNIVFLENPMFIANNKLIVSKAIDNRVGCSILLGLAKKLKNTPNEIYYIFSIQEEIGLTGGSTFAYNLNPDFAIAVDVTDTNDFEEEPTIILNEGPAITIEDPNMISDSKLNETLKKIAKKNKIKYQLEINEKGTTDATNIEVSKEGIPCTSVCVPVRNVHTTFTIASLNDIDMTFKLLYELLKK